MCRKLICLASFVVVLGPVASVSADLVAHWKFNDSVADSVGTLNWDPNAIAYSTDAKEGSKSLSLDGVGAYLSQTPLGPLLDAFITKTVSFWFKANTTSGVQVLYDEGGSTNGLCIRINDGQLEVAVQNRHSMFTTSTDFSSTSWTHVALIFDRGELKLYVNGVQQAAVMADFGGVLSHSNTSTIGYSEQDAFDSAGGFFGGLIDDVRLYSHALTQSEIACLAVTEKACMPSPANGAQNVVTPLLEWQAGSTAAFHDVYFGTTPTLGAGDFAVQQPLAIAMYFHTETLTPGTTYYWRVDEVEADRTTAHTGDVWSFTSVPLTAHSPDPADRQEFVDPNTDLKWGAGITALTHDVYFGTTNPPPLVIEGQSDTLYDPGPLAKGMRYYWRIDEVELGGTMKYPGEVWRFTTRPAMPIRDPNLVAWWKMDDAGTGTVIDYSGYEHHGTLHGNALLIPGYDGESLELHHDPDYVTIDGWDGILGPHAFSITAWLKTGTNGTIVGWGSTAGGTTRVEFRINDDRLRCESAGNVQGDTSLPDDEWMHVAVTVKEGATISYPEVKLYLNGIDDTQESTDPDPLDMAGGYDVTIGRRHSDTARWLWGTFDDIRIYDKELTQEEIEYIMLRPDPLRAWDPTPADNATPDIEQIGALSWSPGDTAAKHDVYFGTDEFAVEDADTSDTSGIYRGRQDARSYPILAEVEYAGGPYYWRIDEVEADLTTVVTGRLWSFSVADYLVVDDFEDYNDYTPDRLWQTWLDGFGYSEPPPGYAGNGTGSRIGNDDPPFTEQGTVHSGLQAMTFRYTNDGSTGKALYSETQREWAVPQDWTRKGVQALTLWFTGYPATFSSVTEDPVGTFTVTARSADTYGTSDSFHYVFKRLSGNGSITAKVETATYTSASAKIGVMIRDTLDPTSRHAFTFMRPDGGVRFNRRHNVGDTTLNSVEDGLAFPHWVQLERSGDTLRAYHSTDGTNWVPVDDATNGSTDLVTMGNDIYIGLVVCSNNTGRTCTAVFSNVTVDGGTGAWQSQDIGINSNVADVADQLYVAVEDSMGTVKAVPHEDPNAVLLDSWQEWNIDLKEFANAGVNLASVKKMYLGVGNRTSPQMGGTGTLFFDDIRLYRPRCLADVLKPDADFSNNCVVDYPDLQVLLANWLVAESDVWDATGGHDGGGSLAFGNAADYVAIQDLFYNSVGNTQVSVSAWIRTDSEADQYIVSFDRNEYYRLEINGSGAGPGQVGWDVWTDAGQSDYGSVTRVDDDQWHHVVGVFDNGTSTIYIDGIAEPPVTVGTTYGSGTPRFGFLGANSEASEFDSPTPAGDAIEQLDDVRIYDYALSASDVTALANGTGQPATGPILWYKLDETAGQVALDSSGNGYDGHLRFTWFDINIQQDSVIDLKDYALLVDGWLDELLWPQP